MENQQKKSKMQIATAIVTMFWALLSYQYDGIFIFGGLICLAIMLCIDHSLNLITIGIGVAGITRLIGSFINLNRDYNLTFSYYKMDIIVIGIMLEVLAWVGLFLYALANRSVKMKYKIRSFLMILPALLMILAQIWQIAWMIIESAGLWNIILYFMLME